MEHQAEPLKNISSGEDAFTDDELSVWQDKADEWETYNEVEVI